MRLLTAFLLVSTALPALAQIAEPPAPSNGPVAVVAPGDAPQLEDIGYDPKVKRDPYGNIIGEKKPGGPTPAPAKPPLRSDKDKGLRSDRTMIKAAPQPASPAPAGNPAPRAVNPGAPAPTAPIPTNGGDSGIGANANSPHP